jgi:hypothetical protein
MIAAMQALPLLPWLLAGCVLAGPQAAAADAPPAAAAATATATATATASDDDDAPDPTARRRPPLAASDAPRSYAEALQRWRTAEQINDWIGARFEYDRPRALVLSESQRARGPAPAIHEPAAFFDDPVGICVDLARFGVETLRAIDPASKPRYLMIEFDPLQLQGQTLRRHWIALFERPGQAGFYAFADSKRPGVVSGPHPSIDAFAADYAAWRGRRIVAQREMQDFRRQQRALRQQAGSPSAQQRPSAAGAGPGARD